MKESFRQSMLLLHSWFGLTAGWLLFFVFLTGTAGFLKIEISRWMRPELPLVSQTPPAAETLAIAERYLNERASRADFWSISLPGHRGNDDLAVSWRLPRGQVQRAFVDLTTGDSVQRPARATGGGNALYVMHYALHYVSRDLAIFVVGVAAMMMLVLILTGITGHKTAIRDFFTLRARGGYASWRSGHTLIGVTAFPFFLMMTWSGLLLFMFVYMPVTKTALFPTTEAEARFSVEAFFPAEAPYGERNVVVPPSITAARDVLDRAENFWGNGSVVRIRIDQPGTPNAKVTAYTDRTDIMAEARVAFDVETGAPIPLPVPWTTTAQVLETIVGLHKGHFAGPYLRFLYVICGLAGTALIGTGLVYWSAKRKAKTATTPLARLSIMAVDRMNLATVIGLPIGIAAYFWANRLLAVDLAVREQWEVHAIFITWGAAFLYVGVRPQNRAWMELSGLAAAAYGLIPVLNALTTDRHLGVTVRAGDWVLAGFDLTVFVIGAFFAALAWMLWRKRPAIALASKPVVA